MEKNSGSKRTKSNEIKRNKCMNKLKEGIGNEKKELGMKKRKLGNESETKSRIVLLFKAFAKNIKFSLF